MIVINTYMIPPTLPEIGKPVPERNLNQFKRPTNNPCHFGVTNDHHFEPPATEMCDKVNVKNCLVKIIHT